MGAGLAKRLSFLAEIVVLMLVLRDGPDSVMFFFFSFFF